MLRSKGFTTTELLIIMAIIGILSALFIHGKGAANDNKKEYECMALWKKHQR